MKTKGKVKFSKRNIKTDACVICGVPAGVCCRSTETWKDFSTNKTCHRIPTQVDPAIVSDDESTLATHDEEKYLLSQNLEEVT